MKKEEKINALINILANLTCNNFTKFMRSIGYFGEYDMVMECDYAELGKLMANWHYEGFHFIMDTANMCDWYLYARKTTNDTIEIIGVADDYFVWKDTFDYEYNINRLFTDKDYDAIKRLVSMGVEEDIITLEEAEKLTKNKVKIVLTLECDSEDDDAERWANSYKEILGLEGKDSIYVNADVKVDIN